jgi:transcriptional regulator with XRE-family HTH domain
MSRVIITPEQCRAARELLNWNQESLSNVSGISQSTISNFERSETEREIKIGTLLDIIAAFEESGVRFQDDDGRYGVWLEYDLEEYEEFEEEAEEELK